MEPVLIVLRLVVFGQLDKVGEYDVPYQQPSELLPTQSRILYLLLLLCDCQSLHVLLHHRQDEALVVVDVTDFTVLPRYLRDLHVVRGDYVEPTRVLHHTQRGKSLLEEIFEDHNLTGTLLNPISTTLNGTTNG